MSRTLKALVVDDDEVLRIVTSKQLKTLGIESVTAENGTEAIEKLNTYAPDFVLMDIQMPEQDGLDATRWIRDLTSNQKKDILIFALTSFGQPEHTIELKEAGFNEHLIKPFDLTLFKAMLKKYFPDF